MRLARETVRAITSEASMLQTEAEMRLMEKWALSSSALPKIAAMIHLLKSEQGVAVSINEFDSDPMVLNTPTGLVDLKDGGIVSHKGKPMVSQITGANFDSQAECPTWEKFLDDIMAGDKEMVKYIQTILGYALTGMVSEQCLFFMHGEGANGKSTFIETLRVVMGDYIKQTDPNTFTTKRSDSVRNDIARLQGSRVVTAVELGERAFFDEVIIKQMTGADTIAARFLYQETFEMKPTWKIILSANHKPTIAGADHAIWRRIKLIPFEVTFTEKDQDKMLMMKLAREADGILRWMVDGAIAWRLEGINTPKKVTKASAEYRTEMDVIAPFVEDRCSLGANDACGVAELYQAYLSYCRENRDRVMGKPEFGKAIKERFPAIKQGRSRAARHWKGISINRNVSLRPEK